MITKENSMSPAKLTHSTAIVTGASRGFGRAIASELVGQGARVIGVARSADQLDELRAELGTQFTAVVGDATDVALARELITGYRPHLLVLNAGAIPVAAPLDEQTWESFNRNWDVDTQHVFHWVTEALRLPLAPGSSVISISSGAAIGGSPLSGGYASAKAAIRFISAYAAGESKRNELWIRFTALLPQLTPSTDLGADGVAAYAAYEGVDVETFTERFEPILSPAQVGRAIVELVSGERGDGARPLAYLLPGSGLREIA
jgi:NAD(P)-dependent dehydrogenase (short-subunit alcohol dehydrogenase family)